MSVIANLSVRKILNIVFLVFAVSLCTSLLIELRSALQSYALGEHLIALAEANRAVSQTMQALRDNTNEAQGALQNRDDAAGVVTAGHAKAIELVNGAIATVERSGAAGVEKPIATVKADWQKVDEAWGRVEALAKKAKTERDAATIAQWYRLGSDFNVGMGRMSVVIDNGRPNRRPPGRRIRRNCATGVDRGGSAGLECSVARPLLATAKQLAIEDYSRIAHFRGTTDTAFAIMDGTSWRDRGFPRPWPSSPPM